ncbi:MAG TPA: aminoglycoside phosphotransferase family protein [Phenylobacterium sp.]|nr:aminoglycoside phosphotransferase family protein [Phenylobacterium sp.]
MNVPDEAEVARWLQDVGLAEPDEVPTITPLAGGVSSDVLRVDLRRGPICVKRALPQLKVKSVWCAPVVRSDYEVAWLRTVRALGGPMAPEVLAADPRASRFAMTWFPPERYRVWKGELAAGRADADFAETVGRVLARIHGHSAGSPELAVAFATDALFESLRIEPYLRHTAKAHPDLGSRLLQLADETLARKTALVHGDVSPKNILVGPEGPVFLDAECAWFGDPAFDIAFCGAHLLLKAVWRRAHAPALLDAYAALCRGYLRGVGWERPDALDHRAGALIAALLLARVDGKSPVEYLTASDAQAFVRRNARQLLTRDRLSLKDVGDGWREQLERQ